MTKAAPLPDQDTLKELLFYDPLSGNLFWRPRDRRWFQSDRSCASWNTKFAGKRALNTPHKTGYVNGCLLWRLVLTHRVIWKLLYGDEPDQVMLTTARTGA